MLAIVTRGKFAFAMVGGSGLHLRTCIALPALLPQCALIKDLGQHASPPELCTPTNCMYGCGGYCRVRGPTSARAKQGCMQWADNATV